MQLSMERTTSYGISDFFKVLILNSYVANSSFKFHAQIAVTLNSLEQFTLKYNPKFAVSGLP